MRGVIIDKTTRQVKYMGYVVDYDEETEENILGEATIQQVMQLDLLSYKYQWNDSPGEFEIIENKLT